MVHLFVEEEWSSTTSFKNAPASCLSQIFKLGCRGPTQHTLAAREHGTRKPGPDGEKLYAFMFRFPSPITFAQPSFFIERGSFVAVQRNL